MYGYKIKINTLPQMVWATETTVSDYYWENRNKPHMLEISYSTFESKTQIINGKKSIAHNNTLNCIVGDEPRSSFSESSLPITIASVAVKFDSIFATAQDFTKDDFENQDFILLPAVMENLSLENELEILTLLHKLIHFGIHPSENNKISSLSTFFKLLTKIDSLVRDTNKYKKIESYDYYIQKTDAIIKERCTKKLTLDDVAAELNISPVYLSTIYKKRTGISFTEKLLNTKMKKADELLINQNIPTARVAAILGFCNENYFRKKFKQFYGITVGEYRKIKSGMALLHKKPIPKNYKTQGK